MAKGNSKAYLNSTMVDNTELDVNDNAMLVQYAMDLFNAKRPDLSKPEEVEKAINNYFQNCIDKGLRPGNLALYSCLGLDKRQVNDMLNGRIKLNANNITIGLIKKACEAIRGYREILGSTGKLSPPVLIFWQKNFDGLEDVQRLDVTANTQENADLSPDEIANKIETDVPIDTPFETVNE